MTAPKVKPAFKRIASDAQKGLIVKPILRSHLYNAEFADFTVHFYREDERSHDPDDYFHPSTHPMMSERQLYYYLTTPESWLTEDREYMGTLSIIFGTAVHSFIQMVLGPQNAGILVPPTSGICPVCRRETGWGDPEKCNEHGVVEEKTKSKGHMDGLLRVADWGIGGFEFKTSNAMKLRKIQDLDNALFRETWPGYWAQVQDYMRMTGLPRFIVLFLSLGFPWEIREFHIEYDPFWGRQIEMKYLSARSHVAAGIPPDPCCAPKSAIAKACPAAACQIKRLSA